MSGLTSAVGAALLVGLAVVVRPRRAVTCAAALAISGAPTAERDDVVVASIWHDDPVERFRAWRLRRRPDDLHLAVLALLDAVAPALRAGLSPGSAVGLAVASLGHTGANPARGVREPVAPGMPASGRRHGRGVVGGAGFHRLCRDLVGASESGLPLSPVWAAWAETAASDELRFVAAAWSLSDTTGAPLATAVDRARAALRDARARRSRVAAAVAGPKATVTVLTILPLTGPLFGLMCGVDPLTLYAAAPVAAASAVTGVGLMVLGRSWCSRLVRSAVRG